MSAFSENHLLMTSPIKNQVRQSSKFIQLFSLSQILKKAKINCPEPTSREQLSTSLNHRHFLTQPNLTFPNCP